MYSRGLRHYPGQGIVSTSAGIPGKGNGKGPLAPRRRRVTAMASTGG